MTRKDYKLIADVLAVEYAAAYTTDAKIAIENVTGFMAAKLAEANPRFDRQKFDAAVFYGGKL